MRKNNKIFDSDSFRKKRETENFAIRKEKHDSVINKRRNMEADLANVTRNLDYDSDSDDMSTEIAKKNPITPEIEQALPNLMSDDPEKQLMSTTTIRRLLSMDRNPPIDAVLDAGCLPRLIQFLSFDNNTKLQFEATWAMTNIASGTSKHTWALVENGAVAPLIRLLSSSDPNLVEQSVWALGNISGDGSKCRDYLLSMGCLTAVSTMITSVLAARSEGKKVQPTLLRNAAWAFSNLFRGKPAPSLSAVSGALPVMSTLLGNDDSEVVVDVLWAVTYFTDSGEDRISHILTTDIVPKVIAYLSCQDPTKQMPALRAVGNILTGSNEQTQAVLDMGALQPLFNLVGSSKRTLRKEACWAISNIAAGTPEQIQMLLTNEGMKTLFTILVGNTMQGQAQQPQAQQQPEGNFELRKEIAWIFANISSCCSEQQLKSIDPKILTAALCANLKIKEAKLVALSLLGIKRILDLFNDENNENVVADYIDEIGGVDVIEELQSHQKYEVYQTACDIITQYFCLEDEDGDDVFDQSNAQNGAQPVSFSFAASSPSSSSTGNTFFG